MTFESHSGMIKKLVLVIQVVLQPRTQVLRKGKWGATRKG
jgi:hypothetical protein